MLAKSIVARLATELVAKLALLEGARFKCARVLSRRTTPNPSIEGMPKRLRLLCTPHVKR